MSISVEIFSRHGCHLCEVAEEVIRDVQKEVSFDLRVTLIDDSPELSAKYGEEVPVTLINGERHDYFRIERERFKNALLRLHQ